MQQKKIVKYLVYYILVLILSGCSSQKNHVWEMQEIALEFQGEYDNPYSDITSWITLTGPDFKKKVYGFWDGGNTIKFRFVATAPGKWNWQSDANVDDAGLKDHSGEFTAVVWTDAEKQANPNRRGFVRSTANGHALQYADGTPFFLLADTWWAASTWRFPFMDRPVNPDFVPGPDFSFQDVLHYRKSQGYNSITMIAAYPSWNADDYPPAYMDENGIGIRQAWEKNGKDTAKEMHDEYGNRPFEMMPDRPVLANFDRINPEYFKSLDKKMQYLVAEGFIPFLETVRRDHGPSWMAYFDFDESFARYAQYIISRYGAFNMIFSGIHLDWINKDFSLQPEDYNQALSYHLEKYGALPFGQPCTPLIDGSTFERFGHADEVPWLNMHCVGNVPRNHGFYPMIETLYNLEPPYPAANLEPYYPGWENEFHNNVLGEIPKAGTDRDNYFGRAQMYGSVLSGALAGHVYGTGAYCGNTTGEPKQEGARPFVWEALKYESGAQMQYLKKFILSEGAAYQNLVPSSGNIMPSKAAESHALGLDGWSFMAMTRDKKLAFLYFENKAEAFNLNNLLPNQTYSFTWYDVKTGEWKESMKIASDVEGKTDKLLFPDDETVSCRDWAAKLVIDVLK